jgi:SAM-dependent methyltransferase
MPDDADRIIGLYDRHAESFDKERAKTLFEKSWLDRFFALLPRGGTILDLGCGSGEPIARYFIEAGFKLTGADSSENMIALCRQRFPNEKWIVADMRSLSLTETFNGVLAWDSFFHLRAEDQRKMFPIFSRHAAHGSALMFTSGPHAGVAIGEYESEPLYHASLDPGEYRALFAESGFEEIAQVSEDPACGGRTVWLARRS